MTRRPRRHAIAKPILVGLATVVVLSAAGCTSSDDDKPAVVTLPENNTTTIPPSTLAPGGQESAGPTEPPELAWVVQVGGAGDDSFNAVTGVGADVVASGTTSAGVDAPTTGGTDVLTARVDSEGEVTKLSQFGSVQNDAALAVSAGSTADGAPVACGTTLGALGAQVFGGGDAWCGPAESQNPPGTAPGIPGTIPGITQMGGDRNDSITGLAVAGPAARSSDIASGYLYMSGSTDGFYPGAEDPAGQGLGAGDALAFRATLGGETSWIRQFGTPAPDAALGVCAVGSEAFYVGWTEGNLSGASKGGRDAWISFIDASGIQRWINQFGSAGNDEFRAVANAGEAARGNMQLIAVGSSSGDIDSEGPAMNAGMSDAIVASFAPDGSVLWSKQFGSGLDDSATAVVVDGSTIYVAGTTTSEVIDPADAPATTNPGDESSTTTTTRPPIAGIGELDPSVGKGGGKDAFLAALDASTGEVLWVSRLGSDKDDVVTAMSTTGNGLLVISGNTTGQLGKNTPGGGTDGFLLAFPLPAAGGAAASSV